jgi:hypothetical protein
MKATKDLDIYTLNFVLFVTFVLKFFSLVAAYPLRAARVKKAHESLRCLGWNRRALLSL